MLSADGSVEHKGAWEDGEPMHTINPISDDDDDESLVQSRAHLVSVNAKCTDPDVPTNGVRIGENFAVGQWIIFKCKPGFLLMNGSKNRRCLANTQWSGKEPECVPLGGQVGGAAGSPSSRTAASNGDGAPSDGAGITGIVDGNEDNDASSQEEKARANILDFLTRKLKISKTSTVKKYLEGLEELGAETVEDLLDLDEKMLTEMGMKKLHIKKFLRAQAEMQNNNNASASSNSDKEIQIGGLGQMTTT